MKKSIVAALAVAGFGTSGCAQLGGFAFYGDATFPQGFQSLTTPDDKPAAVAHGEACNTNILFLVNMGNAGVDAAYKTAMASVGANSLYDVRVDTHVTNVFFFYTQVCTEVTGKYLK